MRHANPPTVIFIPLTLTLACGQELPTLGDVLKSFEAEFPLHFELCSGGFVDCGAASAVSAEFVHARNCLIDAWGKCRPTHFDYYMLDMSGTVHTRHAYVAPNQAGCNLVLFEYKRTGSEKIHTLNRSECTTLVSSNVCGEIEFRDCSLVEAVQFSDESWTE